MGRGRSVQRKPAITERIVEEGTARIALGAVASVGVVVDIPTDDDHSTFEEYCTVQVTWVAARAFDRPGGHRLSTVKN